MLERKITSIEELLGFLAKDTKKNSKIEAWYRGQTKKQWSLIPGGMRTKTSSSEFTRLQRFKQNATLLTAHTTLTSGKSYDWLFLMQHYGVPTRLLDWTESPLVGLYFAVDKHPNHDGALWILCPTMLNKHANFYKKKEKEYLPSFGDDAVLDSYMVESLHRGPDLHLPPVGIIAMRNNERIQAQLGTFTIHHQDKIAIEKIGDSSHVIKYIIPKTAKKKIAGQLELLAFGRFQLFPELESIGALIKEKSK